MALTRLLDALSANWEGSFVGYWTFSIHCLHSTKTLFNIDLPIKHSFWFVLVLCVCVWTHATMVSLWNPCMEPGNIGKMICKAYSVQLYGLKKLYAQNSHSEDNTSSDWVNRSSVTTFSCCKCFLSLHWPACLWCACYLLRSISPGMLIIDWCVAPLKSSATVTDKARTADILLSCWFRRPYLCVCRF